MGDADKKTDNKPDKQSKSTKKKSNSKIDIPTIIFFVIMVVGLIVLTIFIFMKPKSKIYSKQFGDDIVTSVEIYTNGNIDVAVDADNRRILQSGKFEEILDDDIENNYKASFKDTSDKNAEETTVTFQIKDDTLHMVYDNGTEIEFKENE